MTTVVINDILPRTQIVASGGQTVYSTTWTANVATDVQVYSRPANTPANDATQILTYSTDYTVAFVGGDQTVQVTLLTPSTLGDIVTIIRNTPSDRVNFYSNTNFTPQMLNNDFGILTLVDQQAQMVNQEIAPRYNYSELLNQNAATEDVILPLLGANQAWVKNAGNTAIIALDVPSGVIPPSTATFITEATEASLPNSYKLTAGTGIGFTVGAGLLTVNLSTPVSLANGGTNANLGAIANNIVYCNASAFALSDTLPTLVQGNITQLGAQSQALNMNSHLINNVTDPVSNQDAATKHYVDTTALNGTSVYAASASNLTVTQSGAGVGATLTNAGAQATFALDGVNPPVGVNVLIKNIGAGGSAANYGIYTVTNVGSGSTNWVLTRATSYDTATEINDTGLILVQNGSTLAGTAWYNSATIVTVDTTNFVFTQFGNVIFPITLAQGGTNASLTASNGGLFYSTATAGAILSGTATANQIPLSGSNSAPSWSTTTYPATSTKGDIVYASANNTLGGLGIGSTGQILTIASGVPAWTTATYPSTAGTSGNILTSNGTNFVSTTPSGTGTVQLIATGNASNVASISFTNLSSTYAYYYVVLSNVQPVTNAATLNILVSTNNGSSYSNTAYYYAGTTANGAGTTGHITAANTAQFALTSSQSNASFDNLGGIFNILNPGQSSRLHQFNYQFGWIDSTSTFVSVSGSALWASSTAINAIQFSFSSGNINTGVFKLYGVLA